MTNTTNPINKFLILLTTTILACLIIFAASTDNWTYSSKGDLRGTQTDYLDELRNARLIEIMNGSNATTSIANPASVYCLDNNGTLDLITGQCAKDGKQCDEWAYFRGECSL